MLKMTITPEHWPTRNPFRISGYTFTDCEVIVVELSSDGVCGRGETAGVYYHEETVASMTAQLERVRAQIESGASRQRLRELLPAGGARCALDCALWDLEAKQSGVPVFRKAGLQALHPLQTTYTVSAGPASEMADTALAYPSAAHLKLKLTGEEDEARLRAVRSVRPEAWIAVDANQGLTRRSLEELLPVLVELDIQLIEQPLPVGCEAQLRGLDSPIPMAADESVQSLRDVVRAQGLFQVVNIKLDKCGGLTEALDMVREIRRLGMKPMVGCMQGTTLSIAPACVVGALCEIVDLDAPMFLTNDRVPSAVYQNGTVTCPADWGFPSSGALAEVTA
jgi:L-alanine-DL-glutamate epimerase-like enolase superfamily enzyme